MIFFILVGGAPRTIWDHIKPKNGGKKGPKTGQKRAKIEARWSQEAHLGHWKRVRRGQ